MTRSRDSWLLALALCVCAVVLGLSSAPLRAQSPKPAVRKNLFSHVMKSADVDAAFAKITDAWDVYTKTNHAVTFRVATKKTGVINHAEADEYWFVRKGAARVALGTSAAHAAAAGDVVYVPRNMSYDIDPSARFEYVALRVFAPRPAGRGAGAGQAGEGGPAASEPTSYFATKAQTDQTFATETNSATLRFPGGASVNQIIYNGAIGPYESHEAVDQIYFVRYGTAKAIYDGRLVNPTVTGPGQIRGTGVLDGSEYTIAPGDIVFIPRNQVHFVDPGTGKVGYFLVGMPSSQSAFPAPPPTPGRGRGAQ
jgi:mannose-6-phosphate isomerase-like protein (cupin superfamily)